MFPRKTRFSTFNDGVLFICKPDSDQSDFNAVKNPTRKSDLTRIMKLNYQEKSKRDQDLDFAESQGRVLTMKVMTRLHESVTKSHQVLIDDCLYGIINVDKDRNKQEMYFYLEEIRRLHE